MPRLINSDALETAILEASWWDNGDEGVAWKLVQEAPTVEPETYGRWVPVTERLPDKEGSYLCYFDGGFHGIYDSGNKTSRALWSEVTHWMPLPEPPEEGIKNEKVN